MTYFLISNRGAIMLGGRGTQLPVAIGPGDEPIVTVDLVIGDDPNQADPVEGDEDIEAVDDVAAED
jgi:hypothetical protein